MFDSAFGILVKTVGNSNYLISSRSLVIETEAFLSQIMFDFSFFFENDEEWFLVHRNKNKSPRF